MEASTIKTESNGFLSVEDLNDRTRYTFRTEVVDLPELNGKIKIRALSVGQREALPKLVDKNGNTSLDGLAALFAAMVVEPEVGRQQAKDFLGAWPAPALDRVLETLGELSGTEQEMRDAAREFRAWQD